VVVHNQEPLDMVGQNQVVFSFAWAFCKLELVLVKSYLVCKNYLFKCDLCFSISTCLIKCCLIKWTLKYIYSNWLKFFLVLNRGFTIIRACPGRSYVCIGRPVTTLDAVTEQGADLPMGLLNSFLYPMEQTTGLGSALVSFVVFRAGMASLDAIFGIIDTLL
jgi:hypothetical protein